MKVAVIGGGSSYTPELIKGFLERVNAFALDEIWLMDISQERLDVVGGLAQRMVAAEGQPFEVKLTTDRREALRSAHYVITQLRVGGMEARREDEYLGRRHGLVGQETTGVGGMAKALRTIPIVLDIAKEMRSLAPGALLVNFTNPSGLITEALTRYAPSVPIVGVCNSPFTTKMGFLELLKRYRGRELDPDQVELDALGLNHLSWYRGLSTTDGEDLWPEVLSAHLEEDVDSPWTDRTIEALQMVPNYYLEYYYYTEEKVATQESWPPSRAEEVMEIEDNLLSQYAEPDRTEPPEQLMERGGSYYSTIATQILNAHYNDLREIHIVSARHGGAVDGWPEDWVLEMPCRIDHAGVHPLSADPLPPVCFGLLAHVKMYEILTAQAAVTGDRDVAYRALLVHPLGPSADRVQEVLDDLLETHRQYLPQFWGEG